MSKAIPATPVCSTNPDLLVANTGTSQTVNIPLDPNCRTVVGGDQTVTPDPSN